MTKARSGVTTETHLTKNVRALYQATAPHLHRQTTRVGPGAPRCDGSAGIWLVLFSLAVTRDSTGRPHVFSNM